MYNNLSAVAERLKQEGRQEVVQSETTEELEDEDGNVYNRKTYDDLKKQGLIWYLISGLLPSPLTYSSLLQVHVTFSLVILLNSSVLSSYVYVYRVY